MGILCIFSCQEFFPSRYLSIYGFKNHPIDLHCVHQKKFLLRWPGSYWKIRIAKWPARCWAPSRSCKAQTTTMRDFSWGSGQCTRWTVTKTLAGWLIIICNNRGTHTYIDIYIYVYIYTYIYIHIHTHYPIFGDYIKRHCGNPYQPTRDFRISMRWTQKKNRDSVESIRVRVCTMCIMQNNTDTHTQYSCITI